jgi:hypothetical protein
VTHPFDEESLERGNNEDAKGHEGVKQTDYLGRGLFIIGFVVASALLQPLIDGAGRGMRLLGGLNHDWRREISKILNVTCLLSHSIIAAALRW